MLVTRSWQCVSDGLYRKLRLVPGTFVLRQSIVTQSLSSLVNQGDGNFACSSNLYTALYSKWIPYWSFCLPELVPRIQLQKSWAMAPHCKFKSRGHRGWLIRLYYALYSLLMRASQSTIRSIPSWLRWKEVRKRFGNTWGKCAAKFWLTRREFICHFRSWWTKSNR